MPRREYPPQTGRVGPDRPVGAGDPRAGRGRASSGRRIVGSKCPRCLSILVPARGNCDACFVPTAQSVDVADTGPGIGQEERERIFRPFWSTDSRGTGLGLPIARELAVALGGRIELQTEQGQGSRFRLVLPL